MLKHTLAYFNNFVVVVVVAFIVSFFCFLVYCSFGKQQSLIFEIKTKKPKQNKTSELKVHKNLNAPVFSLNANIYRDWPIQG